MAAGRMLAVCAYRDATRYAGRPFDRSEKDAAATVLQLLPQACDGQGHPFRRDASRAFGDLSEDRAAGLAPVPRGQAETWASWDHARCRARMCAADDEELPALGVSVPTGQDEAAYRSPYFEEEARAFLIEDASTPSPRPGPPTTARPMTRYWSRTAAGWSPCRHGLRCVVGATVGQW
ncbi:hypothetical protein ABT317_05540 [Streptomyces carpinensis]|uniref:Uncharacterized protein n=1 Tax=Streptomyces carpinensis TaxID=66369 RepID=A0ABV1VX39_9ACTN